MTREHLVYVIRPNGTALYLPALLAESLGVMHGALLTVAQYEGDEVQGLIERRMQSEGKRKRSTEK